MMMNMMEAVFFVISIIVMMNAAFYPGNPGRERRTIFYSLPNLENDRSMVNDMVARATST